MQEFPAICKKLEELLALDEKVTIQLRQARMAKNLSLSASLENELQGLRAGIEVLKWVLEAQSVEQPDGTKKLQIPAQMPQPNRKERRTVRANWRKL